MPNWSDNVNTQAFSILLFRELLRTVRQPSRLVGILMQPLLFWLIMGSGFGSSFRVAGNLSNQYTGFFFPGMLAMVILFSTIFNTITLIEDRNSGFMQAVLVSPSSRIFIVAGKIAGVSVISLLQVVLLLVLAPLAGITWVDFSWTYGIALLIFGAIGLASAGFALAWISATTSGYHAVMSTLLLPLWLVSGAVFPVHESWLQYLVMFNPMSWLVAGLRAFLNQGLVPVGMAPVWLTAEVALILLIGFSILSAWGAAFVCLRKYL